MEKHANKFSYFRCLNMESFSIPTANKIFHGTVLLLIYCCDQFVASEIRHSRCHCSVCQQTTITTWYSRGDKILIKSLYLKMYTAKRLTYEFPEKSWTKHGVNKVLKNWRNTDTVDIATTRNHTTTGSFQSHPHFTKENNYAFECLIFLIYR